MKDLHARQHEMYLLTINHPLNQAAQRILLKMKRLAMCAKIGSSVASPDESIMPVLQLGIVCLEHAIRNQYIPPMTEDAFLDDMTLVDDYPEILALQRLTHVPEKWPTHLTWLTAPGGEPLPDCEDDIYAELDPLELDENLDYTDYSIAVDVVSTFTSRLFAPTVEWTSW